MVCALPRSASSSRCAGCCGSVRQTAIPCRRPEGADRLLLDAWSEERLGGTGASFDWDLLRGHPITSELILLFLYLGYMALRASFDDTQRADRASAILAIVGVVNVPIVKYSVVWWNSLHQAPTISKIGKPAIELSMAWPLYTMLLGFMLYFAAVLCDRVRSEILRRERNASWLTETVKTS